MHSSGPRGNTGPAAGRSPDDPAMDNFHGTTILSVRRDGGVALGGDGQVTLGAVVVKSTARKFSRETLKLEVTRALEQAYEKGKKGDQDGISEMLYRAIKGDGS